MTVKVSDSILTINMIGSDEEIRKTVNIVFDKYDQNKNGYMELPEIAAYLNDAMRSEEGRDATEEEIRLFLHAGDMDCDQKITKMELFKILKLTFSNH
jgi:Ca2+-binding EF-hand superfamily protein